MGRKCRESKRSLALQRPGHPNPSMKEVEDRKRRRNTMRIGKAWKKKDPKEESDRQEEEKVRTMNTEDGNRIVEDGGGLEALEVATPQIEDGTVGRKTWLGKIPALWTPVGCQLDLLMKKGVGDAAHKKEVEEEGRKRVKENPL